MSNKDYFINQNNINAYTINAFAEAIAEATQQGLALNYDSARRIGSSFSISIVDNSTGEVQVETQETSADQTESFEAQPADADGEEFKGLSEDVTDAYSFYPTGEQIDAAKDSMAELNKLAEPFGITGRSKKDLVKQLKELVNS